MKGNMNKSFGKRGGTNKGMRVVVRKKDWIRRGEQMSWGEKTSRLIAA